VESIRWRSKTAPSSVRLDIIPQSSPFVNPFYQKRKINFRHRPRRSQKSPLRTSLDYVAQSGYFLLITVYPSTDPAREPSPRKGHDTVHGKHRDQCLLAFGK